MSQFDFSPVQIDEAFDDEIDEESSIAAPPEEEQPEEVLPELDTRVQYAGRTFVIGEPTTGDTLALLAFVAKIARRASKSLLKELKAIKSNASPSGGDVIAKIVEQVAENPRDLAAMTCLVLFGDNEAQRAERQAFFDTLMAEPNSIKMAPLVRGLMLRVAHSDDLRDTLGNFGYTLDQAAMERTLRRQQLRARQSA